MTAPTLATTPADITLPDLERAARSPLTWQIFPWGLSGASGQRWVRDQLVIVNPALPAEQRRRQLAVVRSWIPAGEATVLLVTLAVPLWLAIALHTFWPLLGWIVPALLVMRPSDVDSATYDFAAAGTGSLPRLLGRVFDRHAPRADRVVLGGASRYGQINYAGAHLHQVLLNLALEHRRWIVETDPGQEQQVHDTLWAALKDHPIPDLVSLAAYLDQLAVNPVTAPTSSSPQCPAPHTCCRHRPVVGEWS